MSTSLTRTLPPAGPVPARSVLPGPVLLGSLDLERPVTALSGRDRYRSARLLVRLHTVPLGELLIELGPDGVSAADLARLLRDRFGSELDAHLADDLADDQAGAPADDRAGDPAGCRRLAPLRAAWRAARPITVVVATRDRTASLLRCLRSLAALDHPGFDVVVVDSAPRTDETAEALQGERSAWPFGLTYLRTGRPGLARAHTAALAAVTGEVVAFTDDDVEVDADWLAWIAAGFADAHVLGVTGLILPAELETPAQLRLEQAGGFGRGFVPRRFRLGDPPPTPLFPFATGALGSGANMAFRTSWLRGRGGFDPATGAGTTARGGDDLLAFLSVLYDGGTLAYRPEAVVRHHHHRSVEALRRQAFGYGVGTGAYLAAALRERPGLAPAMARRMPGALRQFVRPAPLDSTQTRDDERPAGADRDLLWRRCLGLCAGPAAYALSRLGGAAR